MHVAPADFRSVRTGELVMRFAVLGDNAYVLAQLPETGSAGTPLEEPCARPHWGLVVDGSLEVELGRSRRRVDPGDAFHVPAGVEHRLSSSGPARVSGFEPVGHGGDVSDDRLRAKGYDIVAGAADLEPALLIPRPRGEPARVSEPGEILANAATLGDRIVTRARFGTRSGYTSEFCDLPHWGLVTAGSLAIEWEDAVEVVTAGEVYHCPAGPPGHRFLAADPAAIIDFTPVGAVRSGGRVQAWRPFGPATDRRRRPRPARKTIEVAPLV